MALTLVQPSDFVGEIQIANKDQEDVSADLNGFIAKYEPDFLKQLFGLAFYNVFIAGIALLDETSYFDLSFTNSTGFTIDWQNDIPEGQTETFAQLFGNSPNPFVYFGTGNPFTPGGQPFEIYGTANVTNSIVFDFGAPQSGYIRFEASGIVGESLPVSTGNRWTDLIANTPLINAEADFIYYWYIRDQVTQTVGIGNVKTVGQNAVNVGAMSGRKLIRAWNEMVKYVYEIIRYIMDNSDIYPEYVAPNWLVWRMNAPYWWMQDFYLYPFGFNAYRIPDIFNSTTGDY